MKHVLPRFCSPAPRPTVAEAEEPPPFACGWPLAACCLPLLWECVLCAHAGRGPVRRAAEATGRGEAPGREKYELPFATMARGARDSPELAQKFVSSSRPIWAPRRCVSDQSLSLLQSNLLTTGPDRRGSSRRRTTARGSHSTRQQLDSSGLHGDRGQILRGPRYKARDARGPQLRRGAQS